MFFSLPSSLGGALLLLTTLADAVPPEDHHAAGPAPEKRFDVPAGYDAKPYYPTPPGGWVPSWTDSYTKAKAVVGAMTLAEKVNLTTGTGLYMGRCVGNTGSALRFGIPQLCLQDSALGVARTDNVTAFPAGITVGATWDRDLMYARGAAIGAEHRAKGVNIHLGPTVGPLGRKPRGGRGWEGFGADPVLQGVGAMQHIRGVQAQGVIATVKHYIGNEQEEYRKANIISPALSSNIDDRTLHELYLWPFAEAVRAGVGALMTAQNDVNGSQSGQNSYLINGILKDELGFQGFAMCDWLSQASGVASALAGLDMAMPGDTKVPLLGFSYWAYDLSKSVLNGSVPLSRLDDMVTRIVASWYQMRQDGDYPEPNFSSYTDDAEGDYFPGALFSPCGVVNEFVDVQGDHKDVARAVARDSITMLKNEGRALPLKTSQVLHLFGTDQAKNPYGLNSWLSRRVNEGTLGMGWGSGTANYPYMDDPLTAIKAAATNVKSYNNDTYPSNVTASASDIAIVFINSDSGENSITVEGNPGDRTVSGLTAWHSGDKLIQDAAAQFSTVIVVIHTVGPILVDDWIDHPSVKSVLIAHLPGQEAGGSLTDILFGAYSPSGHLPYSIPKAESDYPASFEIQGAAFIELSQIQDTFSEGLYIDYRYLNAHNITPRYPFGHGLSYTTFAIANATLISLAPLTSTPPTRGAKLPTPVYSSTIPLAHEVAWPDGFRLHHRMDRYLYPYLDEPEDISNNSKFAYPEGYSTTPQPPPAAGGAQGGNPALFEQHFSLTATVTNTGSVPGRAVPQLYVQFPQGCNWDTPMLQLRNFTKTGVLGPGEGVTVEMGLSRKDLSVWDVVTQQWVVPGGDGTGFKFWVGWSVVELELVCEPCKDGVEGPVCGLM